MIYENSPDAIFFYFYGCSARAIYITDPTRQPCVQESRDKDPFGKHDVDRAGRIIYLRDISAPKDPDRDLVI